jgi:hypothetical protein
MEAATKWAFHWAISYALSVVWWLLFGSLLGGIGWMAMTCAIGGQMALGRGAAPAGAGWKTPAAVAIDEAGAGMPFGRAAEHVRAGEWAEAEREFSALQGVPTAWARAELGLGVARLGQGRSADAVAAFTALLGRNQPEWRVSALLGQALALQLLGKNGEAMISWNLHCSLCDSVRGHTWDEEISKTMLCAIYFGEHEPENRNPGSHPMTAQDSTPQGPIPLGP